MKILESKIVVITGAGTGIGKEAALLFANEGARTILVGRRLSLLESVAEEIALNDGIAEAISVDLEDGDAIDEFGRNVLEKHGAIDILVNNAGHSSKVRSLRYVDHKEWDSVFKVNIEAVYRLTQNFIHSMIEHGEGTVITVSSMAALNPSLLGGAPYSAAKAASHNLMGHINSELNDLGIRACTIFPAEVDTPILNNRPLPPSSGERASMMQPKDIAQAILLCASMPQRTVVEEIVLKPTKKRDVSADLYAAATKQK